METPAPLSDNFSSDYYHYVKLRVQESPLSLQGNRFFEDQKEVNE